MECTEELLDDELADGPLVRNVVVSTAFEARREMQVLKRSARFREGVRYHLKTLLRELKEDERLIRSKMSSKSMKKRSCATPPMKPLLKLDPLQHLASPPMTPLDLSDTESVECVDLREKESPTHVPTPQSMS